MACYYPLKGWRSSERTKTGKRKIVFTLKGAHVDQPVSIPCGSCIGCRLERSRQWAIRCMHEASLHPDNTVVCLTYDPEHLPQNGSLVKEHFQLFMKRLRKVFPQKIRYLHCGEYGENLSRPHYHAVLFNCDFTDKEPYKKSKTGHPQWTSETLNKTWGKGFCTISSLTFDTAAYVARYITKKITGDDSIEHYQGKQAEYITMSRRPGLARGWYDKWKDDVYPSDSVVMNGYEIQPPKFYDRILSLDSPAEYLKLKHKRLANAPEDWDYEQSPERLGVKEKVQILNLKGKRSYENEK